MTRRVMAALLSCTLVVLCSPNRAEAFFDWIDDFSGPGPFWGPSFDISLFCVTAGPDENFQTLALNSYAVAQLGKSDTDKAWKTALNNLKVVAGSNRYQVPHLPPPVTLDDFKLLNTPGNTQMDVLIKSLKSSPKNDGTDKVKAANLLLLMGLPAPKFDPPKDPPTTKSSDSTVSTQPSASVTQLLAENIKPKPLPESIEHGTPAVAFSNCELNTRKRRLIKIDVDTNIAWNRPKTRSMTFAKGARIALTTVQLNATWSPIDPSRGRVWNRLDFFDLGMGVGAYVFTSKEFDPVSGMYFQPMRFDLHAPTAASWLARVPVFRVGAMVFPKGFRSGAFGGASPNAPSPPISRDLVRTWGLEFNLEPILSRF